MPPRSKRRSGPRQPPAGAGAAARKRGRSMPSLSAWAPMLEEPVSMTPWQPPRQASTVTLPTRTARICTCQKPMAGCETGNHLSGAEMRSRSWPPNTMDPSAAPREMAKCGSRPGEASIRRSKKLPSAPVERPSRERPRMPSCGMSPKGRSARLVAASTARPAHALPALAAGPRQTSSRTSTPLAAPSPRSAWVNSTVTTVRFTRPLARRSPPGITCVPSAFTSTAVSDFHGE
mmetsp:Transcript_112683/g.313448  ORF Transcript_112683/g.313448 Transcript_112683/m.313448 type:complete len:233 (-) Transcript_112683:369-1067(-)